MGEALQSKGLFVWAMAHLSRDKIIELAGTLARDVWGQTHREWAIDDRFYNLDIKVEMPQWVKSPKVVPSTGHNKINHAVDQLVGMDPAVFRRPVGSAEKDKERADRLAAWGGLLMRRLNREAAASPPRSFFKHLLLYGYAAAYGPTFNSDIWPPKPEFRGRRRGRLYDEWLASLADWEREVKSIFPFWLEVPHPTRILLDPTQGKAPAFGILRSKRWAGKLRKEFGADLGAAGDYDLVDCYTYWSEDQYTMVFGEEGAGGVVQDGENEYGFVPFIQAFAGFGKDTAYGSAQDSTTAMAEGLLHPIRSTLESDAHIATAMEAMVHNWGFQRQVVRGDAKAFADAMENSPIIGVEDPQKDVRWQEVPNVPAWVLALWQERRADAEAGTFGEVLRGQRTEGVSTASQHAQIVAKAKLIFNAPLMQLNHAFSIFLGNCGRLVSGFGDPVTMYGEIEGERREIRVEPEDFQGDFNFEADFTATDPMERAADLETGLALRQSAGPQGAPPGIPWEDMQRKYAHEPDVVGMRERLEQELVLAQARRDPQYWALVWARVQKAWMDKTGMVAQPVVPAGPSASGGFPTQGAIMGGPA